MPKLTLRYQKVSDAKRFYEILDNPHFIYFDAKPKSVRSERDWLKQNPKKMKDNFEYNYAILYGNKLIGGCGIKVNQHRKYIGEIGYFIDEDYWGRGIAPQAVKLLERIGFQTLNLRRIEIWMKPKNKASQRVAVKCGYQKEGIMKKAVKQKNKFYDSYLYAKVK